MSSARLNVMLDCVSAPGSAIGRQLDMGIGMHVKLAMSCESDLVVALLKKSMGLAYAEPQLETFRSAASLFLGRSCRREQKSLFQLFRSFNNEESDLISWLELYT